MSQDFDFQEELDRKSGEAYSWLNNEYTRGAMSANAYYQALMALDMALLGLIPRSYSNWACEERKALGVKRRDSGDTRVFTKNGTTMVVTIFRDEAVVVASQISKSGVKRQSRSFDEAKEATARFENVCTDLAFGKDFTEVNTP